MKLFTRIMAAALVWGVVSGCGNESPKLVPVPKIPKEEFSEKPTDFAVFNPKVDILFVIDNSGSMSEPQDNLARNAQIFADEMSRVSILDYHIGVVSTDMSGCGYYGGEKRCGHLVGSPRYVEKSTPDMVAKLSARMVLGTNGSATEEMFSPVIAALSPSLENTVNAGFYRQDAFLAVIVITDANEQSTYSPDDFMQFLVNKKGDPAKVLGYGVIRKLAEENICQGMENLDEKLETFLGKVINGDTQQSNVLSLCDANFGMKLVNFAKDIVKRSAGVVKLTRVPNVKTIRVFYGTQEIPNSVTEGWTYQPSTNTINLASGIQWDEKQPTGTGLRIDFEVIDLGGTSK